jgi:hypothetical protein
MPEDIEYYRRRERQERESADRAEDIGARRIHQDMADRYSAKLREVVLISPASAQT